MQAAVHPCDTQGQRRSWKRASFPAKQDVQTWLQEASLWNVVANTNQASLRHEHPLCGQSDDLLWDWADSRGEFYSAVMFQASFGEGSSHE